MKNFKFAVATLAALTLSMTAQSATFNTATTGKHITTSSKIVVKKARTVRVVKQAIKLPAPRHVATHTTRSVLFYNPAETRTKVIIANTTPVKTPNLFKD